MTEHFASDGKEGEFAENKGMLCHRIFLTDTRHGGTIGPIHFDEKGSYGNKFFGCARLQKFLTIYMSAIHVTNFITTYQNN